MLRAALSLLLACCLVALAQQPVITGHIVPHSHDDGLLLFAGISYSCLLLLFSSSSSPI